MCACCSCCVLKLIGLNVTHASSLVGAFAISKVNTVFNVEWRDFANILV